MLEIASGNQNLRAKETGAHELREVTRQFNAMLDQIDQLMALNWRVTSLSSWAPVSLARRF